MALSFLGTRSRETDMFVITLVPLPTAGGDVLKSIENFRYLGGGDFTGRVFCSTLDGKFVKAFGYFGKTKYKDVKFFKYK